MHIGSTRAEVNKKTMTTPVEYIRELSTKRRSKFYIRLSKSLLTDTEPTYHPIPNIYIYTWPHTLEYIHTLAARRPYALVYFHTFPSLLFLFKTSLEKKKTPKQTQRCRSNPQECPTRWRSTCTSTRGRSTISSSSSTANTVQSSIRF